MRLLLDAQLPKRLAGALADIGHDVIHTSELPEGNRTADAEIALVADEQGRVVVTKDHDFLDGHLLAGSPTQLLLISTGNIRNDDLIKLFISNDTAVRSAFDGSSLVELSRDSIVIHD